MATTANQVRDQINLLFTRLTVKQKLTLFVGFAVGLAVIFLVLIWTAKPNYEVLFSNLEQKDAGKILEKLKEKDVDYRLEKGGTTIMVATDKVYELRLAFAQEGLPASSSVGYEIFDKTNLGMTDFVQKVNYRRALEGELSRTIERIDAVDRARVHIVIPKEALFKEDENPHTASVILKLKGSGMPSGETVRGIANLIASSVEGLAPENVTILDTRGRILSDNRDANDMIAMSTTQLEFVKKVENYLARKVQSMLNPVVGPGNAVVRVSADLNFTQVEKNIERYDPDNTAVRSEEIQEESTPLTREAGDTGRTPTSTRSSTITNYEVNRTVQRVVEGVGNIERLSVAVIVNNKREVVTGEGGTTQIKYTPRTREEMQMLTELVQTAIGSQSRRNDKISVTNVDFSVPTMDEELLETDKPGIWHNWYNIIEKVFLFLAIVASMLIMRSLFSQVRKRNEEIQKQVKAIQKDMKHAELPWRSGQRASATGEGRDDVSETDVLMAEDFFKSMGNDNPLNEKLRYYIREKPDVAARLIKVWLLEDEGQAG